uniref:Core shell protein Gag P30 domain-containing protein n=1 Tax=Accipiter nisus TaxID=211598 RepID=A0A8B9NBF7_9AVES
MALAKLLKNKSMWEGVGNDGLVYVKVPFSVTDLMAWKQAAGVYREDPERVGRVVDTIIRMQNLDWSDLQAILDNLLDDTEKQMVLKTGKAQAEVAVVSGITGGTLEQNFPSGDPQWDPNNVEHREKLRRYQKWILYGVKHAMPKSLNWSKIYEVRQDKNESPSAFLERLKEAARKYTDLRVDTEAAQIQLALIFMGQSAPDIRKKLQKLEGEDSRSLNKMLEAAWKVYNNREKEERKTRENRLLAVMTGTAGRGRGRGRGRGASGREGFMNFSNRNFNTPLGVNQCALCRERVYVLV